MTTKTVQFTRHAEERIQTRFAQFGMSMAMVERVVSRKVDSIGQNSEVLVKVAQSKVKISLPDGSNGDTVLAAVKIDGSIVTVKTVMLRRSAQIEHLGQQHHGQKII